MWEAGGGRREGATWKRLKRLKRRETRCDVVDRWGWRGGTRGGLQREQTNGPLLLQQKRKRRESERRRPSGDEDWVCRLRWAFWRHHFHWGEQMSAPGGTVHTSSAKKGARPLASRSRGSETLCIFIASSNRIVNCHEKGFRVLFCRTLPLTVSMPFATPIFHPSSRPLSPVATDVGRSIWPPSKLSEILEAR